MMNEGWYVIVDSDVGITQGDIIADCPLLEWKAPQTDLIRAASDVPSGPVDWLSKLTDAIEADVIVMTQACDLEHGNVSNVVLCPCLPLSVYKAQWEVGERSRNQNPSSKSWSNTCERIKKGYIWNLSMLDAMRGGELPTEHRIVDFHLIFTAPRLFLDDLIKHRAEKRLRLLPPYREHLSQSFARFFMRVGLPQNIKPAW